MRCVQPALGHEARVATPAANDWQAPRVDAMIVG